MGTDYAPWDVLVFDYRKMFGLSYREWLEEPSEEFLKNLIILNQNRKYEKYLNDRAERKAKKV